MNIQLPFPKFDISYLQSLNGRLGQIFREMDNRKVSKIQGVAMLTEYTVSTVPTASDYEGGLIYVSDETGGATLAFSDGTNWRRVQDRTVIA